MGFCFPEDVHSSVLFVGLANAVTCDIVSMKNFVKGWFEVIHWGANDTDLTFTLTECEDVAGTGNNTVTVNVPIWLDTNAGTASDVLVRQADGTALTVDPATQNGYHAIFEWDPANATAGHDCAYIADGGAGGNVGNYVCIIFHGLPRYASATDNHLSALTN